MRRLARRVLVAVALAAAGFVYARYFWGPGPEALERQRREVRQLAQELEQRLREQARVHEAGGEGVLVGVPAGVAERLAGEALAGFGSGIRVSLKDLRFRKADEVRARLLAGRRTIGRFTLSVSVHEVHATLRPGRPKLRVEGERLGVTLPVAVEDGAGSARLRFIWDGRGIAGAVCGDVDVTREITARVPRRSHSLAGALQLDVDQSALVARSQFEDVELRLPIEPSAEAWRLVDELIESRGAVCRVALGRVDVKQKIRELLGHGVRVTIPRRLLERTLRLPLVVERELQLPGRSLRLDARPSDLVLGHDRLWYGVRVELAHGPPPEAAEAPPAAATGPPLL